MFEFLKNKSDSYKQIIIMRTDLKMSKGKLAAQASHASVSSFIETENKNPNAARSWLEGGQKKVVLKVSGENELIEQFRKAKENNLVAIIISDAGRTQIPAGSKTAVGIGPWNEKELDILFGELKLL